MESSGIAVALGILAALCGLAVRFIANFWKEFENFVDGCDWAAGHEHPPAAPLSKSQRA